jgi:hypothetical protein
MSLVIQILILILIIAVILAGIGCIIYVIIKDYDEMTPKQKRDFINSQRGINPAFYDATKDKYN